MEAWFKKHQALIFYIGVAASILTYAISATVFAYTTFSSKEETKTQIRAVKEPLTEILKSMDKRLERIEDAVYNNKERK